MEKPVKHNVVSMRAYVLLVVLLGLATACATNTSPGNSELYNLASEFNTACPMMVDSETRLDSVAAGPGEFHYHYTLVNLVAGQVDTAAFREFMRPTLLEGAKTNKALAFFRTARVALIYHYRDMNGSFVNTIFLHPEEFAIAP